MLRRSFRWCAAVRPRHTWMALMVDECSAMPPTAISSFVQVTFTPPTCSGDQQSVEQRKPSPNPRGSPIKASVSSSSSSSASPSPVPTSATVAPGRVPAERAHAWVAVARLLCESGDWARAAAVVDGLPTSLQQAARFKAIRDDWPLPRSVVDAWRHDAAAAKRSTEQAKGSDSQASATTATAEKEAPKRAGSGVLFSSANASSDAASSATTKGSYTSYRSDALVRLAYSLRKAAPTPSAPSPASQLQREQHLIVSELRRRGAVAEALQCIVNWQRRRLLRPDAEAMQAPSAAGTQINPDDLKLYDGLGAVKALLFPGEVSVSAGGVSTVFVTRKQNTDHLHGSSSSSSGGDGDGGGGPPRYTAAHLRTINEATVAHPSLVARCLRDRHVSDRLLRHAGEATVADFVSRYLHDVASLAPPANANAPKVKRAETAGSAPAPSRTPAALLASSSTVDASLLEVYWRTLAALLPLLHPYWRSQAKSEKEKLLNALNAALSATQLAMAADATSAHKYTALEHRGASTSASQQSAAAGQQGLSDRCRRAIKASVESICSPLLHHEPQVRFLRLSVFATTALHLNALRVAVPNALMQCLFLCMADTGAIPSKALYRSERIEQASSAAKALPRSREEDGSSADRSLHTFLLAMPSDRWLPALALLQAAHRHNEFRVTAAHTRAVLSGLQSVSITKTWPAALRVVAECEAAFAVTPDERTLPTLLLNLKQQSWQNAFRVLDYVPGREPAAASPLILRDLQLVALKHASWEVPLRLMAPLQEQHADGFMNYLYCLCAAARGGHAKAAFEYFCALPRGRGRHTAWRGVSPFNELTVAVAAVAMLDGAHYAALHQFVQRVLAMTVFDVPETSDAAEGAAAAAASPSSPSFVGHALTADGRLMAEAADLAALLCCGQHGAVADAVLALPAESLQPVLRRFMALCCLLHMGHLHAPIRLVFDVLGHGSSPQQRRVHQGFLSSVDAAQRVAGTFETRQRGAVERRKHLFIPMVHQRQQKLAAAKQLGAFVKAMESALPPHVVHTIAETMVEEGVGAEYLAAALL